MLYPALFKKKYVRHFIVIIFNNYAIARRGLEGESYTIPHLCVILMVDGMVSGIPAEDIECVRLKHIFRSCAGDRSG